MLSQKLLLTNKKVHLTLVCSLTDCWVFFFPISVKSKYQNHFDESKAWPGEGLSNPNSSCSYNKAGGQQSPASCFRRCFYPHEGDHSLTPFSTASVKAGIKTLAFLMTESLILPGLTDLCYPTEIRAWREWVVRKTFSTLWFCQGLVLPL